MPQTLLLLKAETSIDREAFVSCASLKRFKTLGNLPISCFGYCFNLQEIFFSNNLDAGAIPESIFYFCSTLSSSITIPANVASIGANAFNNCYSLAEMHCLPTTPPTLGSNALRNLNTNILIYVPVGYGETYKAAAGWSTYANHILEEGQTPNRAMLSRLAVSDSSDTEENNER